jgi:hypothetical protein
MFLVCALNALTQWMGSASLVALRILRPACIRRHKLLKKCQHDRLDRQRVIAGTLAWRRRRLFASRLGVNSSTTSGYHSPQAGPET